MHFPVIASFKLYYYSNYHWIFLSDWVMWTHHRCPLETNPHSSLGGAELTFQTSLPGMAGTLLSQNGHRPWWSEQVFGSMRKMPCKSLNCCIFGRSWVARGEYHEPFVHKEIIYAFKPGFSDEYLVNFILVE